MENNQPVQPNSTLPPAAPMPISQAAPSPVQPPPATSGKKPPLLIIAGVLIFGIALAGGIYFYTNSLKNAPQEVADPAVNENAESSKNDLDIDAVTLEEIEGDFTAIDKDLESL